MYDLVSLALRKKCAVIKINIVKEEFAKFHKDYECKNSEDIEVYIKNVVEWNGILDNLYNELIEIDREIDSITRSIHTAEGRSHLYEG